VNEKRMRGVGGVATEFHLIRFDKLSIILTIACAV